MLKIPLNTNQPTDQPTNFSVGISPRSRSLPRKKYTNISKTICRSRDRAAIISLLKSPAVRPLCTSSVVCGHVTTQPGYFCFSSRFQSRGRQSNFDMHSSFEIIQVVQRLGPARSGPARPGPAAFHSTSPSDTNHTIDASTPLPISVVLCNSDVFVHEFHF